MRALLVVALLAATLAGAAAAGDVVFRVSGTPASISLPTGWRSLTRAQVVNGAIPAAIRQNPQLGPVLRALRTSNVLRLFAYDTAIRGGFATNVNAVVTRVPGWTFARFAREAESEIDRNVGGLDEVGRPAHSRVRLPTGPAVRAVLRLRVRVGGSWRVASVLQYAVLHGGKGYVFTFTTLSATAARYRPLFDRAARSIRFS